LIHTEKSLSGEEEPLLVRGSQKHFARHIQNGSKAFEALNARVRIVSWRRALGHWNKFK
jgi:hypothetical protein